MLYRISLEWADRSDHQYRLCRMIPNKEPGYAQIITRFLALWRAGVMGLLTVQGTAARIHIPLGSCASWTLDLSGGENSVTGVPPWTITKKCFKVRGFFLFSTRLMGHISLENHSICKSPGIFHIYNNMCYYICKCMSFWYEYRAFHYSGTRALTAQT